MRVPLCIKPQDWPPLDQMRWREAREVTTFLSGPQPARRWSVKRRRIVEQAYGQWLSFLARRGWLDPDQTPEARATPDRVRLFVLELQQRVFAETFDLDLLRRLDDIQEAFGHDLSQSLADVIVYGDNLGDSLESAFKRVTAAMLEAIIQAQILGPLLDSMGKGGGGGLFTSLLSSIGFRASGGPVSANRPYMVGERGPELIVPRLSGHVIPNHRLGGERTIKVDVTPSPYFDVRVSEISNQSVATAAPALVNASVAATMNQVNRRRLPRGLG